MKTIKLNINNLRQLTIGFSGENAVSTISVDYSAWIKLYGPGSITLSLQRSEDTEPYPVTLTIDEPIATWQVSNTDTQYTGWGKGQFSYYLYGEEEPIKKSQIFRFFVNESLTADGGVPDPYQSWYNDVVEAGSHYPVIIDNYWYFWSNGKWINSGIVAQAQDGFSPEITYETITGGHRVTITDAAGTQSIDIMDGLKGDKGDQGIQGETGAPFTYNDFTPEQLEGLRGPQGIQGVQGVQGIQGVQGQTGNGISSIMKTDSSGLTDTYTITYTNGLTTTFSVVNGQKGDKGDQGIKGDKGDTGETGATGATGPKGDKGDKGDQGIQGIQGIQGVKGDKGDQGIKGDKGDTGDSGVYIGESEPVDTSVNVWIDTDAEPTDVVTEELKQEIVNLVLAEFPVAEEEVF